MDYQEAVEIVIQKTGHERYRFLVSEDNPSHAVWRRNLIIKAGGTPEPEPVQYPSRFRMAGNAVKAAGQFVASGFALASDEERARRLAICREPCEFYDAARGRCTHGKCGCFVEIKVKAQAQKCPIAKW